MAGKLKTTRPTRRDADDAAVLKIAGNPAHINAREDRLLAERMPQAHGEVITSGLLAEAGRRGDDRVTRLTPAEAALLKRGGGAGTRNPASGLLEFYGGGDMSGSEGQDSVGNGGMSGDSKAGDTMGGGGGDNDPFGFSLFDPNRPKVRAGPNNKLGYDPNNRAAVESLLAAPNFTPPGMSFTQYKPRDTWGRFFQELFTPSVKAPGRYGAPTKHGPGIFGDFLSQITPALSLGPVGVPAFGLGMRVGGAMGRASSPETQAASAAEDAARSAHNSTGSDPRNWEGLSIAELERDFGAPAAGSASGASATATPPPGFTTNPAGQIVPMAGQGNDRAAWKTPVENLLYDYIWRGPSGRGW